MEFTEYENGLMTYVKYDQCVKLGEKTTICLLKLDSGFEVIGSSACVDPKAFDAEIGSFYAKRDALRKLGELIGFLLQEQKVH